MNGREAWAAAGSLEELGELTAQWLEGDLDYFPGYDAKPDSETSHLISALATLNRAGFVTDFSQPAYPVDTGGNGQRAALTGFCSEPLLEQIRASLLGSDLVLLAFPPALDVPIGTPIVVTIEDGEEFTWIGHAEDPDDIRHIFGEHLSPAGLSALLTAEQAHIVDPQWGRDDLLWARLTEAVELQHE